MKGKYKVNSTYCHVCDIGYVPQGKRCENCGARHYGVKVKKPNKQTILRDIDLER